VNNTGTKKGSIRNNPYFEEKNGECAACLKYSVLITVEKIYIKCNIWRVAVRPSYIWDARFLKVNLFQLKCHLHVWNNLGENVCILLDFLIYM